MTLTQDERDSNAEKASAKISEVTGTAESLLREWYTWWKETPDAPVSMPGALHVRTALLIEVPDMLRAPQEER
jgi:hypothetical protein